ncbi:MAG: hypothetical protein WC821_04660 [archaeon]|jgi:chorismate mutase
MEKAIDINELRTKLDQINELIIIGLKNRSRFPLNTGTFIEKFSGKESWFLYRLKKEQSIDAEFGRYLYNDQSPIIYSKKQLSKSKVKSPAKVEGIKQEPVDVSKEIIALYKEMLFELCEHKEDKATYGETTKMDVDNILLYTERIVGLGEQVAGYKMQQNPTILKLTKSEDIRKHLVNLEREKEVIDKTVAIAQKYGITNTNAIRKFTQKIIDITTEVEIKRILSKRK